MLQLTLATDAPGKGRDDATTDTRIYSFCLALLQAVAGALAAAG